MDRYLFRGKRIDNGEWVYGYYKAFINLNEKICAYINVSCDEHGIFNQFEIDPKTIGQWSGLKDKNGTKIFEGDVLTTDYKRRTSKVLEPVKLENGGFNPFAVAGWECTPHWKDCEIIGDIHDNRKGE